MKIFIFIFIKKHKYKISFLVSYTYDTWGVVKSTTGTMRSTIGNKNPFRYRNYYFDTDLALYYLNSHYYDLDTSIFMNADGILLLITDGSYILFYY